jgi:hypothetical protein
MRDRLLLSVVLVSAALACAPASSSAIATPTAAVPSASPTPRASTPAPATASPTATTQPRIAVSDGPLTSDTSAYLFFQLPNDARFRAISFDGAVSGIVPLQVAPNAIWSQSPGTPVVIGTTAYTREGVTLGAVPWLAAQFTWSSDGRFMCAVTPEQPVTGSPLRLAIQVIGQSQKPVGNGFGAYSDNASYTVLACDEGRDRAVVASFGQGLYASHLWIFRISNAALVREVTYDTGAVGRWVAASADGSLIAESEQATAGAQIKATIRLTDDGAVQATLDGVVVQGFSGDNTLTVAADKSSAAVVEWKTGRRIWSAQGTYGGFLPEPAGRRLAVGIGFVGGSEQRDVYLVRPDGSAALLPAGVRVGLRY